MKNIQSYFLLIIFSHILILPVYSEVVPDLTIYQVMQRVIDRYPTLKIANMEVTQSEEQRKIIESSLGWILDSTAGVTHDLTGIGTPSDRLDVSSSINRKLKTGGTLSLIGSYRYEDSSLALSPILPNPAHTTRLDLQYRLPLLQGYDNPEYNQGIIASNEGYNIAKANLLLTKISLSEKVKDLFFATVLTQEKLNNAKQSVVHAKKNKQFIRNNLRLGVADKKDKLQVQAQLDSSYAQLSALKLLLKQQQSSLNRLMENGLGATVNPILSTNKIHDYDVRKLISMTTSYHPTVSIAQSQIEISDSKITQSLDSKRDNLDIVMSAGSRTSDGTNATSRISEQDWAGSISLQYKHLFDNKGVVSQYNQAKIDRNIAEQNLQKIKNDIRYLVSGLVSEIVAADHSVSAALKTLKSESLKLKEADHRFRNGRANTAQLIQFQNEYSYAQLSYKTQQIELQSRLVALQILTGKFWGYIDVSNGVVQ